MQPNCSIHIQITNLIKQSEQIGKLFHLLKAYKPGRGLQNGQPVLLGFNDYVNLATIAANHFPELVYSFDGTKPPLQYHITNHEVLFLTEEKEKNSN